MRKNIPSFVNCTTLVVSTQFWRVRSRLCRSWFLRVNINVAAMLKICKFCTRLHCSHLRNSANLRAYFLYFCWNVCHFGSRKMNPFIYISECVPEHSATLALCLEWFHDFPTLHDVSASCSHRHRHSHRWGRRGKAWAVHLTASTQSQAVCHAQRYVYSNSELERISFLTSNFLLTFRDSGLFRTNCWNSEKNKIHLVIFGEQSQKISFENEIAKVRKSLTKFGWLFE